MAESKEPHNHCPTMLLLGILKKSSENDPPSLLVCITAYEKMPFGSIAPNRIIGVLRLGRTPSLRMTVQLLIEGLRPRSPQSPEAQAESSIRIKNLHFRTHNQARAQRGGPCAD